MRTALKFCAVLLLSAVAVAQSAPAKKKSSGTVTAQDVRELRQALAAQQQQIQQMQEEMRRRDQLLEQMQQALARAQTAASSAQEKAVAAQSFASQQGESVSKVQADLADVKPTLLPPPVQRVRRKTQIPRQVLQPPFVRGQDLGGCRRSRHTRSQPQFVQQPPHHPGR